LIRHHVSRLRSGLKSLPRRRSGYVGLRKPRKIAEDSGRSSNGRQALVIVQETRNLGTPETPEAEDGTTHE
jgi:hypothetical protein